jgi:hypothetical protein
MDAFAQCKSVSTGYSVAQRALTSRFEGKKGGAKGGATAVATGGGGGAGAAAIVCAPAVTSTRSGEVAFAVVANNSLEFRSDTFRSCYGGSHNRFMSTADRGTGGVFAVGGGGGAGGISAAFAPAVAAAGPFAVLLLKRMFDKTASQSMTVNSLTAVVV